MDVVRHIQTHLILCEMVVQGFKADDVSKYLKNSLECTQLEFTCSKLTIETQEQGVKYVQS